MLRCVRACGRRLAGIAPSLTNCWTIARELAYSSKSHALILWTPSLEAILDVLDPIPAFAEALEHPERWPGMLFWTSSGTCADGCAFRA